MLQACGSPTYLRLPPDAGPGDSSATGTGGHATESGGTTGSGGIIGEGGGGGPGGGGGGPAISSGGAAGDGAATGSGGGAGSAVTSSGGSPGSGGAGPGGAGGGGATSGGGTPGSGGASGGVGGLSGSGGMGGVGGQGGSAGAAGRKGVGGAAGAGGAGGATGPIVYDCGAAVAPASNLITDFVGGSGVNGRWTSTSGMTGTSFVYRGTGSTASIESTAAVHNLHLTATVVPSSYAGGGINFDACTTFGSNKSLRFVVTGSTNCSVEIQLQTYRRKPSTDTPPGGCVADGSTTCGAYAHLSNLALSPSPVTVTLASLTDWNAAAATQVVGIQWQLTTASNNNCTADLHLDDITLVP